MAKVFRDLPKDERGMEQLNEVIDFNVVGQSYSTHKFL